MDELLKLLQEHKVKSITIEFFTGSESEPLEKLDVPEIPKEMLEEF